MCYEFSKASQLAEAIALEDMDADSEPLGSVSLFQSQKFWRINILYIDRRETVTDQDSNSMKIVS